MSAIEMVSPETVRAGSSAVPASLVFCQYREWSWGYAIHLDPEAPDYGAVSICGTNDDRVVAASFEAFIALYLDDDSCIYPA